MEAASGGIRSGIDGEQRADYVETVHAGRRDHMQHRGKLTAVLWAILKVRDAPPCPRKRMGGAR